MLRFLHTSDLHLGKGFGRMPEDLRGRLTEARHGAIGRIGAAARAHGAAAVLVAGDVFDSGTPRDAVRRQALTAMGATGLPWILLPGNHDPLAAEALWAQARAEAPAGVTLALDRSPIPLGADAVILPAPCAERRPGVDPTEGMGAVETGARLRIGLAHGTTLDFGAHPGAIAPDRAETAGLAYLALGDWHRHQAAGPRAWYSGTPEPDSFRHGAPGVALLVTLDGGAAPVVEAIPTGHFAWSRVALDLVPGAPAVERLSAAFPADGRRETLLRIVLGGRLDLAGRAALAEAIAAAAPDFADLQADWSALGTEAGNADLDAIDAAGALREAAEALRAEAADPARSAADRDDAAAALSYLYIWAREAG